MTETDFDLLASKVLAGEASREEATRLQALTANDAAWKRRYAELEQARQILRRLGPLTGALQAAPEPLPKRQLAEWDALVRRQREASRPQRRDTPSWFSLFSNWLQQHPLLVGSAAVLVAMVGFVFFQRGVPRTTAIQAGNAAYVLSLQGPAEASRNGRVIPLQMPVALKNTDRVTLPSGSVLRLMTANGVVEHNGPLKKEVQQMVKSGAAAGSSIPPARMQAALFKSARQLLEMNLLATMRSSQSIVLYSPAEATRSLTPLILWKHEPGKSYDVSIHNETEPGANVLRTSSAMPPLSFAAAGWSNAKLSPNTLYRLRLQETGNAFSTSEHTFRTLSDAREDAGSPSAGLERAVQSLSADPPGLGDALAALLTLPPELGESELALRLKLSVFGQLGFKEEFDVAAKKLQGTD